MNLGKLQISYGKTPTVLLLGNGFNQLYGFASWDELIESISTRILDAEEQACLKNVPYPLRPVILTEDHLGTQIREIANQLAMLRAPHEEEKLLRAFATLPVDGILTANYTYELEKALDDQFTCLPGRRCTARRVSRDDAGKYNKQQLHTWFDFDGYPPVWHIHGEAARHDTMVLGHYYYGKLLAKMQQYVATLIARKKTADTKQQDMEMKSWIDYFMLGDVHIVGLGLALSELDLWWLINCKKRNFPDRKVILYKANIKPEEKLLAEAYGVIVKTGNFGGDYGAHYKWVYEELKNTL